MFFLAARFLIGVIVQVHRINQELTTQINPCREIMGIGFLLFATIFFSLFSTFSQAENSLSPILAKIDGIEITVEEFKASFDNLPAETKKKYSTPEGKEKFLEELINQKILLKEAENRGIPERKEVIQQIKEARAQIIIVNLINELKRDVKITEAEARQYYEEHKDEFRTIDQVRVRHILIRPASADSEADTKAKEKAEKILELIRNGADFGTVAKQISEDKVSGQKGGDLGYLTREQMDPEVARFVFSMNPGEIAGPIKTNLGYHIVKVDEKKLGDQLDFERVENKVRDRALLEKQSRVANELLASLRKNLKIVLDKEQLDLIK
jgi:peptidyl-prolyl cis-trans isomerase C